jgi:hypothetical protein
MILALVWSKHIHFILEWFKAAFILCGHHIILFTNLSKSNLEGVGVKRDKESPTKWEMLG